MVTGQKKKKKTTNFEQSMSQTAKRVVTRSSDVALAVISLSFAIFTFLALFSYSADDPWWMQTIIRAHGTPDIHNYGGKVGAELAGALVGLLGASAWLVPFILIRGLWMRIHTRRYQTVILQMIASAALVTLFASILAVGAIGNDSRLGPYELAGGWLGQIIGVQFFWHFFSWGSWVFLLALTGLLFVYVGGTPAVKLSAKGSLAAWRQLHITWNQVGVRWQRRQRERQFHKEQKREAKALQKAQEQGVAPEMPAAMPTYSETQSQQAELSAVQATRENTTHSGLSDAGSMATTQAETSLQGEQSLPAFFGGGKARPSRKNRKKEQEVGFDSVSMDISEAMGLGRNKEPKDLDATQTLPEFTVIRKESDEKAKKPTRTKQLTMPLGKSTGYTLPNPNLLEDLPSIRRDSNDEVYQAQAKILEGKLKDFGVKGSVEKAHAGPVITVFEFRLAAGTRVSKLTQLEDDLALSMAVQSIRISRFPNRDVMGIEVPAQSRDIVPFKEIIESKNFLKSGYALPFALGKTVFGEPISADVSKMPHLLMGGATGSGKSVGINTLIMSLLYTKTPDELRLFMIDPKMLELSKYENIPHMGYPVVTNSRKAVAMLRMLVRFMEDRYALMMKAGVRNITGYNKKFKAGKLKGDEYKFMPYMVCIVDELADLMMVARKDVEEPIARLAQMARAAGIHMVLATQRPSVDVVTGLIKSNFPARMSFKVSARVDSKTILDQIGAQNLLGKGDMLFLDPALGAISRIHGCFVDDDEVDHVCDFWREQGEPDPLFTEKDLEALEEINDPKSGSDDIPEGGDIYEQAVTVAIREQEMSISRLQRVLGIGYNKAATLMERMEQEGIIGPPEGAGKKRKVLIQPHELTPNDGTPGSHG